jgi:hypothetical protein
MHLLQLTQCTGVYLSHQSQSHITTDGQSVSMSWCQAQSGTFDQKYFFSFSKLRSCLCGEPSLTRGRVCHLSVLVNTVYSTQSVITYIIYILCHTHFSDLQYIQASFSPCFVQQIMPYLLLVLRDIRGLSVKEGSQ